MQTLTYRLQLYLFMYLLQYSIDDLKAEKWSTYMNYSVKQFNIQIKQSKSLVMIWNIQAHLEQVEVSINALSELWNVQYDS